MWNTDALVVLAPLAGLAEYCGAHLLVSRIARPRSHYAALAAGFVVGLAGVLAQTAGALWRLSPATSDAIGLALLNLGTYAALAFGYFNFVNLNIASLRIRMLQEMADAGGSMPRGMLLSRYNSAHVADLRLARLISGGHLREECSRIYRGPKTRFLLVARIFDLLRWLICGSARAAPLGAAAAGQQRPLEPHS